MLQCVVFKNYNLYHYMKKEYYDAARIVHDNLRIKSDCFNADGKIVMATQIVAIGDDITSAMCAAWLFYKIRTTYGHCPKMICVGGTGLLSKFVYEKSEASLLAYTMEQLGIRKERIICLKKGKSIYDNILSVSNYSLPDAKTLWCVTQRLSLKVKCLQSQHVPNLESLYYVVDQKFDDVMNLYNGKGICGGEMLYHDLASIRKDCERYGCAFEQNADGVMSEEVCASLQLLEENFRIKQGRRTIKSYFRLLCMFVAVVQRREQIVGDMHKAIRLFALKLRSDKLVGPGDTLLGNWIATATVGYVTGMCDLCTNVDCRHCSGVTFAAPMYPYNLH